MNYWASQDDPIGYSVLKGFQVSQQYEKWIFEDEDRGLGLLAADVLKDVVKRVSNTEIYYFNPETVLWQEVTLNTLGQMNFATPKNQGIAHSTTFIVYASLENPKETLLQSPKGFDT